ncbi:winged helix-turn-helix transcriptional regulator [Deinococcus sp.]|uniref:winged helix-turn-helix transcriptional regulator n=1 Tax=Deinococcus sp. TaxID=47478 RepID=UPI003C7E9D5B
MDQVTNRWATLVLVALSGGPLRFSALNARVEGISQKMLSQNLKALVRAGLVDRAVIPTVPPQVTYSLTALGADLTPLLYSLIHWIGEHTGELLTAQASYDANQDATTTASGHQP